MERISETPTQNGKLSDLVSNVYSVYIGKQKQLHS